MLDTPTPTLVATLPAREISFLDFNKLNARARVQLAADIAAGRVVINVAQFIEQLTAKVEEIVNPGTSAV
jgi:hypothetical protein